MKASEQSMLDATGTEARWYAQGRGRLLHNYLQPQPRSRSRLPERLPHFP
jgi:hypothetical protein